MGSRAEEVRAAIKDTVIPKDQWEFNKEVADSFDDMLGRSIPQYGIMRAAVFDTAKEFIDRNSNGDIVDIGCSRGGALERFVREYGSSRRFVGLEVSEPMIEAARKRFANSPDVEIRNHDLRGGLPQDVDADAILSVLTLQFTPIEYRLRIIRECFERLRPGGVFVLVEKVIGASAALDSAMVSVYYEMKRMRGYTEEQIQRKRLSLEGVLVPVTAKWNEELLRGAGFSEVDCFWRWQNFAGWVAIK